MNKFFAIIVSTVLALSFISSPAFARNEVVNASFLEGHAISPIQGGTGVANWEMTRPDNGQIMHFEQCWHRAGKGYACKYEVLLNLDHGNVVSNSNVSVDVQVNTGNTGGGDWSGIFESFKMIGNVPHATVTVNGVKQTNAYNVCEERDGQHGRGIYCK